MRGVADPDGVAVSWAYKGGATFGIAGTPTFTTFYLPDQPSFLDLTGRSGNYQATTNIYGGAGNDVVWGGDGVDNFRGGNGDDLLFGGRGDDDYYADDGADTLIGWSGNDLLEGDAIGTTGDGDRDVFVYLDDVPGGNGSDQIFDFDDGIDKIDLSDLDIQDPASFVAGSVTSNAVNLGADGSISIVSFAQGGSLDSTDFIF
jgi:Ca2+-binding RTX toxin-like protein